LDEEIQRRNVCVESWDVGYILEPELVRVSDPDDHITISKDFEVCVSRVGSIGLFATLIRPFDEAFGIIANVEVRSRIQDEGITKWIDSCS
jgi:hypothetical protein